MSNINDIFGNLFGDDFTDKFKVKDYYTLDDAKEKIKNDTTRYELLKLKATCAVLASVLVTKGLISKEDYNNTVEKVTEKVLEQDAISVQKYLNDEIEKAKKEFWE